MQFCVTTRANAATFIPNTNMSMNMPSCSLPEQEPPKQVLLFKWFLVKVYDKGSENGIHNDTLQVAVGGYTTPESHEKYQTSSIKSRIEKCLLRTVDGADVNLRGFIDQRKTYENGFSFKVINLFYSGFPFNWDQSIKAYHMQNSVTDGSIGKGMQTVSGWPSLHLSERGKNFLNLRSNLFDEAIKNTETVIIQTIQKETEVIFKKAYAERLNKRMREKADTLASIQSPKRQKLKSKTTQSMMPVSDTHDEGQGHSEKNDGSFYYQHPFRENQALGPEGESTSFCKEILEGHDSIIQKDVLKWDNPDKAPMNDIVSKNPFDDETSSLRGEFENQVDCDSIHHQRNAPDDNTEIAETRRLGEGKESENKRYYTRSLANDQTARKDGLEITAKCSGSPRTPNNVTRTSKNTTPKTASSFNEKSDGKWNKFGEHSTGRSERERLHVQASCLTNETGIKSTEIENEKVDSRIEGANNDMFVFSSQIGEQGGFPDGIAEGKTDNCKIDKKITPKRPCSNALGLSKNAEVRKDIGNTNIRGCDDRNFQDEIGKSKLQIATPLPEKDANGNLLLSSVHNNGQCNAGHITEDAEVDRIRTRQNKVGLVLPAGSKNSSRKGHHKPVKVGNVSTDKSDSERSFHDHKSSLSNEAMIKDSESDNPMLSTHVEHANSDKLVFSSHGNEEGGNPYPQTEGKAYRCRYENERGTPKKPCSNPSGSVKNVQLRKYRAGADDKGCANSKCQNESRGSKPETAKSDQLNSPGHAANDVETDRSRMSKQKANSASGSVKNVQLRKYRVGADDKGCANSKCQNESRGSKLETAKSDQLNSPGHAANDVETDRSRMSKQKANFASGSVKNVQLRKYRLGADDKGCANSKCQSESRGSKSETAKSDQLNSPRHAANDVKTDRSRMSKQEAKFASGSVKLGINVACGTLGRSKNIQMDKEWYPSKERGSSPLGLSKNALPRKGNVDTDVRGCVDMNAQNETGQMELETRIRASDDDKRAMLRSSFHTNTERSVLGHSNKDAEADIFTGNKQGSRKKKACTVQQESSQNRLSKDNGVDTSVLACGNSDNQNIDTDMAESLKPGAIQKDGNDEIFANSSCVSDQRIPEHATEGETPGSSLNKKRGRRGKPFSTTCSSSSNSLSRNDGANTNDRETLKDAMGSPKLQTPKSLPPPPSRRFQTTTEEVSQAFGLKTSSSGRLLVPPLAHWRNQKIGYDRDGGIVAIFHGSSSKSDTEARLFMPPKQAEAIKKRRELCDKFYKGLEPLKSPKSAKKP